MLAILLSTLTKTEMSHYRLLERLK